MSAAAASARRAANARAHKVEGSANTRTAASLPLEDRRPEQSALCRCLRLMAILFYARRLYVRARRSNPPPDLTFLPATALGIILEPSRRDHRSTPGILISYGDVTRRYLFPTDDHARRESPLSFRLATESGLEQGIDTLGSDCYEGSIRADQSSLPGSAHARDDNEGATEREGAREVSVTF